MLRLVIANLNYSSWSMRAWLALRLVGVDFKTLDIGLKTKADWKDRVLSFSGAGKVPILVDGPLSVHESLAICELLAERYPRAGLWPEDAALRARARAISCEMLAGFHEIRSRLPCNIRGRALRTPEGPELNQEIARVLDIWQSSLSSSAGRFLFGDAMTIADCMFAPVVTRFRSYGVELPQFAQAYSTAIFAHPAVEELCALAEASEPIPEYDAYLET